MVARFFKITDQLCFHQRRHFMLWCVIGCRRPFAVLRWLWSPFQ